VALMMIVFGDNKSNKNNTKVPTSKKIAFLSGACFVVVLIYGMVTHAYSMLTGAICDSTLLITLITITGAVFGTTAATYYNKSRYENVNKIQGSFLKVKYLLLKDIQLLDEYRVQQELESALSQIESSLDNEKTMANQEITYNG
jgi:hypothetical protein